MTLTLAIIAVVGLILFIISFGRIVTAAFQHHVVTGLISLIPGINLVVLPTVWSRIGNSFVMSIIGLVLLVGGWLLGGNNEISRLLNTSDSEVVVTETPNTPPKKTTPDNIETENTGRYKTIPLPDAILYRLNYVSIDPNAIVPLKKQIRITLQDGSSYEGQLTEKTSETMTIKQASSQPSIRIALQDIKRLEHLVKTNLN